MTVMNKSFKQWLMTLHDFFFLRKRERARMQRKATFSVLYYCWFLKNANTTSKKLMIF